MPLTRAKSISNASEKPDKSTPRKRTVTAATADERPKRVVRRKATPVVPEATAGLATLGEALEQDFAVTALEPRKVSWQDIADRAYAIWMDRGCPHGSSNEDWYRAEQQLGIRA